MEILIIYNIDTGDFYFAYDFKTEKILEDKAMVSALLSAIQNYVKDVFKGEIRVIEFEVNGFKKAVYSSIDQYGIVILIGEEEDEENARWFASEAINAFKEIYDPVLKAYEKIIIGDAFNGFRYMIKKLQEEKSFREKMIKGSIEEPFYANCSVDKDELCIGEEFVVTIRLRPKSTELTELEYPEIISINNAIPRIVAVVKDIYPKGIEVTERHLYLHRHALTEELIINIILEAKREGTDQIIPAVIYSFAGRILQRTIRTKTIMVKKCGK